MSLQFLTLMAYVRSSNCQIEFVELMHHAAGAKFRLKIVDVCAQISAFVVVTRAEIEKPASFNLCLLNGVFEDGVESTHVVTHFT